MKRNIGILIIVLAAGMAFTANGEYTGGFKGPGTSAKMTTVANAKRMKNDSRVILIGKIEERLSDEKYLFYDETGSIKVEIDDDNWYGQTVTPKDTVEIHGEIDKNLFKTEIDVKSLTIK